jgi:hypothetical protein
MSQSSAAKILRRGAAAVAVILLLGIAAPILYQMVRFKSHHFEMAELLNSATPEERNLPANVREALLSALDGQTSRLASRKLFSRFYKNRPRDPLAAIFAIASWELFTWLFYSENERLSIIAVSSPKEGGGVGFSNAAQKLFHRSLAELSFDEAVTLAARVNQPGVTGSANGLSAERARIVRRYQDRHRMR